MPDVKPLQLYCLEHYGYQYSQLLTVNVAPEAAWSPGVAAPAHHAPEVPFVVLI